MVVHHPVCSLSFYQLVVLPVNYQTMFFLVSKACPFMLLSIGI